MELEQRIKALEYEMKILKNEIQRTLLDVQEQILIHYYPALRADDSSPSEGTIQSLESIRERRAALDRALDPSPTKKVTLQEIRGKPQEAQASSTTAALSGQDPILKLSGWVSESVKKIGGKRTGNLIEECTNREWLPSGSKNVLLRLASLGNAENDPKQVAINEILGLLLKLNKLLGRDGNVEEALTLIEEANLG